MKSSYKKLGPYIEEVNIKNKDLLITKLLGVSIKKILMPSIANIIGTDLSIYKIIKTNQFAYGPVTSRNGEKISIALLEDEEDCIISTAYTVFDIIDKEKLLPEYLMMWFRRPEFDRYARYMSHGSVREMFSWDELCDTELPIPNIDKQKEIVKEYEIITNRIKLNEELNKKLEETAQTIYKQWFIDFEFPISKEYAEQIGKPELEGKPYKSNGGDMVYNDELEQDIPIGWYNTTLKEIASITMGQSPLGESYNQNCEGEIFYQGRTEFGFRYPSIKTYTTSPKKIAEKNNILMSVRAPVGDLNITSKRCCIGRGIAALTSLNDLNSFLFYTLKNASEPFQISNGDGTIFGSINKDDLHNLRVLFPHKQICNIYENHISKVDEKIKNNCAKLFALHELKSILLSKMVRE